MRSDLLIQNHLAKGNRAEGVLRRAVEKLKKARECTDFEFQLALGELFTVVLDTIKERNTLKNQNQRLMTQVIELQDRLKVATRGSQ